MYFTKVANRAVFISSSVMRNKQVMHSLMLVTLSMVFFTYLVYYNSHVYRQYIEDMRGKLVTNNLCMRDNYVNILRYNLGLNFGPELVANKCNYTKRGPRILCAVFTIKKSHATKLKAVHDTWAKRYSSFFLFSLLFSTRNWFKENTSEYHINEK